MSHKAPGGARPAAAWSGGNGASGEGLRRFGPLTVPQRTMIELLGGEREEDSVGMEAEELSVHQIGVCERLVGKDLVRFDVGWRYSCWFRLTSAGREALGELRAEKQTN